MAISGRSLQAHREAIRERLGASGVRRCGAGSVSWKVNREIVVVAGWGRAILLQMAHPRVAAGIDAHSTFRGSLSGSLRRFRSTVGAMLMLTFGSDDEAIATAAHINRIHDGVSGAIGEGAGRCPAGDRYSAHDPELLRWVHATLLDSIPRTYELLVGPLSAAERDQYCRESTVMEPLLGIPRGALPRDSAGLDEYMRDMMNGQITVTETSRGLARAVLYPPRWRWLWPFFRPVQLVTIGLLPPAIRDAYGLPWTSGDARALDRWAAALPAGHRAAPRIAREWPAARQQERLA